VRYSSRVPLVHVRTLGPPLAVAAASALVLMIGACGGAADRPAASLPDAVSGAGTSDGAPATRAAATVAAAQATALATLGPSDVVGSPGDRMSLVYCVNVPCPSLGDAHAPVTVIEISDYQCAYCGEHLRETQPVLMEEYVEAGKVRLVSHVVGFLPPAQVVAAAAMCANEHGAYFEFQRLAFEHRLADAGFAQQEGIYRVGAQAGVEPKAFAACVDEGRYLGLVGVSTMEATQMGIAFTPSVIINGLLIEGAEDVDLYRRKIDEALAAAGQP